MAGYVLIESRDSFETTDYKFFAELSRQIAADPQHKVTLFLVENGVLSAREGTHAAWLGELAKAGVEILADEFALRERGITHGRLAEGVKSAPLEVLVDRLAEGRKALWH